MPVNTLTDFLDIFNAASGAEKLAFKAIIVNGLNAADIATIITSSNRSQKEALANLIRQAEAFLANTEQTAAETQRQIDLAIAQAWFDALPSVAHPPTSRAEALANYDTINSLLTTETDQFRLAILGNQKKRYEEIFRIVKQLTKTLGRNPTVLEVTTEMTNRGI